MVDNNMDISTDIQQMLFGLGDCSKPLLSTARVIEDILIKQIKCLLEEANQLAVRLNSPAIQYNHILFLMRKNKLKLQRLINYLALKDERTKIQPDILFDDEEQLLAYAAVRVRYSSDLCIKFLKSIGVEISKDINNQEYDNLSQERKARANYISESLSCELYDEYVRSRRIAFQGNKTRTRKFINWLQIKCDHEGVMCKINSPLTTDIILFLAKELIAEIVDMVFLLRRDILCKPGDPTSSVDVINRHSILRKEIFGKDGKVESIAAITPDEVQEVFRRFFSSFLCPLNLFSRYEYKINYISLIT